RSLPRGRGLHVRHRRRGDAAARGRRRRARRRDRDAGAAGGLPRHGARAQRALGAVARVRRAHARRSLNPKNAGRIFRIASLSLRSARETREPASPARKEVPLARPWMGEREEELVLEVLRSGRLSLGPTIDHFEELVAERVGAPYAAAVSSGTAGLHLLCHIAGLGPGDEGITSPVSFVASANCFSFEGATPVLADVDPRTLNLDPAAVEAAITDRTKAAVAADMFGYPSELDALLERRAAAAAHYKDLLAGVDGVETPLADDADHKRSWFVYVVQLAPGIDRDAVMAGLRAQGIGTAEYVPCVHLQSFMRERYGFSEGMFPVAEDACSRTLALPFFTQIEPDEQERVVEALRSFL